MLSVSDTSQIDLEVIPYCSKRPSPSTNSVPSGGESLPIGICSVENTSRRRVNSVVFIHRLLSRTRIDFAAFLPHVIVVMTHTLVTLVHTG